ncbi:hypothetical protein GH816_03015 [Betaproteobacteria bacterium LSUCC0115]|nr:hypothetical protein [Burkholderiales bacterium LSUCC0115]
MNLNVYYDTQEAPVTFDFATYLVTANCARVFAGCEGMNLHIHAHKFRKKTIRDQSTPEGEIRWRVNHILKGVPALLPMVRDVHIYSSPVMSIDFPMFPPGYPQNKSKDLVIPYLSDTLLKFKDKVDPDCLRPYRPPDEAVNIVSRLRSVGKSSQRGYFTITLRTSRTQTDRNSNLDSWFSVYELLIARGFSVYVVPDYEDLTSHRKYLDYPWETFEIAAFDHGIRLALYAGAIQNLCVLNGVMVPLFHSPYPYIVFKPIVESVHQTRLDWFQRIFGIDQDDSFWWSSGDSQRIEWVEDTVENVSNSLGAYLT